MFVYIACVTTFVILALAIFFIVDNVTTSRKLKRNQKLWNEYSKGMTQDEKLEVFCDWIKENQRKHGDKFMYIPKM